MTQSTFLYVFASQLKYNKGFIYDKLHKYSCKKNILSIVVRRISYNKFLINWTWFPVHISELCSEESMLIGFITTFSKENSPIYRIVLRNLHTKTMTGRITTR